MKAGWELKTLGEVCDFKGGSQPPKSEFINEPQPGYVRMLQIRDFKSDDKAVYIPITDKTNQCAETDIMIGRYGASVGQIHRGKSGAYNVALIRTIPDKKHIDQDYLYHYLTSDLFQKPLMSVSKRGAQDGFSKPDIAPFQIPLPPLAEQKRIVSILDEAFEGLDRARENAEANLKNARELFDVSLDAVFNSDKHLERTASALWEHKALGDISYVKSGGTPSKSKKQYWSGSIPWYSSGELNNRFTGAPNQMISQEGLDGSNAKIFAAGSLLIGIYDTAAMKMSILDRDAAFNQAIVGVLPGPGFSIDFLHLALKWMKPRLMDERRGTRQKNLSLSKIKEIQVPQPPLEEQHRTVGKLNNLEDACKSVEHLYRTKLQDISDLRQSLLQKAFAGELT